MSWLPCCKVQVSLGTLQAQVVPIFGVKLATSHKSDTCCEKISAIQPPPSELVEACRLRAMQYNHYRLAASGVTGLWILPRGATLLGYVKNGRAGRRRNNQGTAQARLSAHPVSLQPLELALWWRCDQAYDAVQYPGCYAISMIGYCLCP